ncbi:MAG: multicopper oxidase domain-containing protein [Baekduiaceae bacterium]
MSRRALTRREVVGAALAAAAAVSTPRAFAGPSNSAIGRNPLMFVSPRIEPFVDPLPVLQYRAAGGELVAANARHRYHRDLAVSDTAGFGGQSYLGPVLEAHRGQPVTQTFRNELTAHPLARHLDPTIHGASLLDRSRPRMSIHLHGGLTEPGSDGHPLASTRAGQTRVHHYDGDQEAAGLWYHDHAMGITRLNVYAGLAGHYLLRDDWDTGTSSNPLGLPAG